MLKLAIEAQLPLVAVHTRDTVNLHDVLKELTKKSPKELPPNGPFASETLFAAVFQPGQPMTLPLAKMYDAMVNKCSTLLLVNPPNVIEPMYDAGEVPVPRSLMMKFLKHVTESEKRAIELMRGLGGCTIKEATELCRLTMARDNSLTVAGLMLSRKTSFQGQAGLTQVDVKQNFYAPPTDLKKWLEREKAFFLTGTDDRLVPRGLLFDGPPGVGKTAGAKWMAEQLGVPLYRVDIGGTKNKYVGQSEGNMLANLARLDGEAPAVALIDEVEKVFGTNGHDTTGTTSTMMSQLLWWLAEHQSRVLTIMTTNNAKALPKELYREGRIDEVMMFEGLEFEQAEQFVASVLKTFGLGPHEALPITSKLYPVGSGGLTKVISQAALTKAVQEHVKKTKAA